MNFKAEIDIMPLDVLLDPQGKAVVIGLKNLGITGVEDVRVGKHIALTFEANNAEEARIKTETACKKLLANLIMEKFEFTITQV